MAATVGDGSGTRTGRRAQVWSSDFTISLIIFAVASAIAFTLITNTLGGRDYEDAQQQASDAAALLTTTGYPAHWVAGDVLRAGLVSDDALSLRKASELATLSSGKLKGSLRMTDHVYIYATDVHDNQTVPIFGACGVGDLSVNSTAANLSLRTLVINSSLSITDGLGMQNVTFADDRSFYQLSRYDMIIIEGPVHSGLSGAEAARLIDAAAKRGITIIVIGDPGIPIFGISTNTSINPAVPVIDSGLGLDSGRSVSITGSVPSMAAPNSSLVRAYTPIASDGPNAVYATWIYDDARIWYISTLDGQRDDGAQLEPIISDAVAGLALVPRPVCDAVQAPAADQVAVHTRTIAYHDELLLLHVLVWRD